MRRAGISRVGSSAQSWSRSRCSGVRSSSPRRSRRRSCGSRSFARRSTSRRLSISRTNTSGGLRGHRSCSCLGHCTRCQSSSPASRRSPCALRAASASSSSRSGARSSLRSSRCCSCASTRTSRDTTAKRFRGARGAPIASEAARECVAARHLTPVRRSKRADAPDPNIGRVTPTRVDVFRIPTRISFGRGVALTVATPLQQVGAKRVLVVTDKGVRNAGLVQPIEERLRDAGFSYEVYDEVVPDPGVGEVQRCFERAREMGADALVAVGGGSAIDTAKMAATLLTNGGTVLDYVGIDKVPKPAAPVVAIPTTAGTGAEITINSVIADPAQNKKLVIISANATALYALEDPEMTRTCPPFVTAITGMDTLVHAIESFVCKNAYPLTQGLCLEAIRDVGRSLAAAVKDGSDLDARERMMRAVVSASLAFSNTRLGNVHAMALPLGGWCHVAHGTAVAMLLPHVMDFNRTAAPEAYATIGEALGAKKDAQAATKRGIALNEVIGVKPKLSEYGATEDAIPSMSKDAMQSGNILVNPRETKLEDIEALYRAAL